MKRLCAILSVVTLVILSVPLVALAQGTPSITIIKPGDRRNVALGTFDVTVALANTVAGEKYSWQVFLDAVPQGMVQDTLTTSVTLEEPSGPHRIRAELYDARGAKVASNEILVLMAPVENRDPIFNRAWYAPAMAVLSLVVIGIILLGLRLRPRTAE